MPRGGPIPSLASIIPKDLDDFAEIAPSKAPPRIITEFAASAGEFCLRINALNLPCGINKSVRRGLGNIEESRIPAGAAGSAPDSRSSFVGATNSSKYSGVRQHALAGKFGSSKGADSSLITRYTARVAHQFPKQLTFLSWLVESPRPFPGRLRLPLSASSGGNMQLRLLH